jgi:ABC-type antimicrobial peptide transport system permease subunit
MRRLSGRFRSALIIGLQGIRARKLRTLLSMVSLFLGVLAVVVVQAGASIADRALLSDIELTSAVDGTTIIGTPLQPRSTTIVTDTVEGRTDAVAMLNLTAIVGEPNVTPVNPGAAPIGEDWGGGMICDNTGECQPSTVPKGQAVEMRLTAMTADVRPFRPLRPRTGQWLEFASVPAMAPKLIVNEAAAKAFARYKVPAEMRIGSGATNITPQFVGVVDDGDIQPHAYVRLDELNTWLSGAGLGANGDMQVLIAPGSPVEQVLTTKLKGIGAETWVETVQAREQLESELKLLRWVFLAMAGLVLLIGVAGILNVGLATVGERVEEFALRRAVGTPRMLLAGIVLAETLLTGLFTAAAAIGLSAVGLQAVSALLGDSEPFLQNLQFPWDAGLAGIIAGLVAGVLGGFIPALRAAGIPIATVMRA